jgi:hypothetical protein
MYLAIIYSILLCDNTFAQTVTVACVTQNCFFVDPSTPIQINTATYTAVITNQPAFDNRDFQWTRSTGFNNTNGDTNLNFSGTWDNVTNNPTRWVKVTVTWHKWKDTNDKSKGEVDGYPIQRNSSEATVIIKHIASISSMTVSNGNPSTISSGGGSTTIPCGPQSFTVSVPTPFTDPNAGVTYTWQLPSGWSGSSTSNTITVNANAGGGGTISVTAKRTDGNFTQTFFVNIVRPLVSDVTMSNNTATAICPSGGSRTIFATATNGSTFVWSATGPFNIYNIITGFVAVSATGNGQGTLTVIADNACNVPKTVTRTIFGGVPTSDRIQALVNSGSNNTINFIYNPPALLSLVTQEQELSPNWQVTNGTGNIYWNGSDFSRTAYPSPFMIVKASATNVCGSSDIAFFYLQDVSGGYYRIASPNPNETNSIDVEMSDGMLQRGLKGIEVVSHNENRRVHTADIAQLRRNANANGNGNGSDKRNIKINVNNLPRGLYYLNLSFEGDKNFTERIVLR